MGHGVPDPPDRGRLWPISLLASLGGLLFGYDIGVISGAQTFLVEDFGLSDLRLQVAVAAVQAGAVVGAAYGGRFADRLGRRRALFWIAVLFGIGALATSVAPDYWSFLVIRAVLGLAVGSSAMITPIFLTETAPPDLRGRIGSLSQTAISVGLVSSYLVDYVFTVTRAGWRPMFAVAVVPAVVLAVGMTRTSDTPRWLVGRGRIEDTQRALRSVGTPVDAVDGEIGSIRESLADQSGARLREFNRPGLRACLVAAVVLGVAQQLSGANTVLLYAPRVLGDAGLDSPSRQILATAIVGAVNLAATIVALLIVDRVGRKPLLVVGFAGMALALGAEVLVFRGGEGSISPTLALVFFLVFIASFGLSISPVGWLLSSEIFPNRLRGVGSGVASSLNQVAGLVVNLTFLSLAAGVTFSGAYGLYGVLNVVFLVFVVFAVPETRGRTLEQIGAYWTDGRRWPSREGAVDPVALARAGGGDGCR